MKVTDKKPTRPGAYWFQPKGEMVLRLVEMYSSGSRLFAWEHDRGFTDTAWMAWTGQWSSRLVPCEEIEQSHREGVIAGLCSKTASDAFDSFNSSRARRVVEGVEE